MSLKDVAAKEFSRRDFLGFCIIAVLAVCILLQLTGCQGRAGNPEAIVSHNYRLVEDWPQLPDNVKFEGVTGVATDSKGRVFIAGGTDEPIVILSNDGKYIDSWGKKHLKTYHGLRIFDDKVWITDREHHQVFEFTLDGQLLRSFGTKGVAGQELNQFNKPSDVAVAPNGNIYISDGYGNARVICLNSDGSFRMTWGTEGTAPGQFDVVHNIVLDDKGNIYIADRNNKRVQVFDPNGKPLKQWYHLGKVYGLCMDADQTLYTTDGQDNEVFVLDLEGNVLAKFGGTGTGPGQFGTAHGIHVDAEGDIYVTDLGNKGIQKFVRSQ